MKLKDGKKDGVFEEFTILNLHIYSSIVGDHIPVIRHNIDWVGGKNLYHDLPDFQPYYGKLHDLLNGFHAYNIGYGEGKFKLTINTNSDIKKQILESMLSDELRAALEYNQLSSDLSNGSTDLNKAKPKI